MNRVIYGEDDSLADIVNNPNKYKTMLTEWFVANQHYSSDPDARSLTYIDFPTKWRWDGSSKKMEKKGRTRRTVWCADWEDL